MSQLIRELTILRRRGRLKKTRYTYGTSVIQGEKKATCKHHYLYTSSCIYFVACLYLFYFVLFFFYLFVRSFLTQRRLLNSRTVDYSRISMMVVIAHATMHSMKGTNRDAAGQRNNTTNG